MSEERVRPQFTCFVFVTDKTCWLLGHISTPYRWRWAVQLNEDYITCIYRDALGCQQSTTTSLPPNVFVWLVHRPSREISLGTILRNMARLDEDKKGPSSSKLLARSLPFDYRHHFLLQLRCWCGCMCPMYHSTLFSFFDSRKGEERKESGKKMERIFFSKSENDS